MIDSAIQADILRLYFVDKFSQRVIANRMKVHRSTVSAVVRRRSVRLTAAEKMPRRSILEPYYALIEDLLQKDVSRSAVNILQCLREKGYTGGITILKDYLSVCRPSPEPEAYLSLEFLPGQAAQVDWGEFGDVFLIGRKVHCFVMVICWSRLLYLEFTLSANFESFIRCHEHAFAFFQGVPREIWYDNLASAVAERRHKLVRFNPRFSVYAGHHRFRPVACNKGAGHEKGRVEDGVGYIRYNFWPGRTFSGLDDLNAQAVRWRDKFANARTHAATRKVPVLMFEQEKENLMPCGDPFDTDEVRSPRVSSMFRINFDSNSYSIPWRLKGKIVTIRANTDGVNIFYGHRRIAAHARSWEKNKDIKNPAHEDGLKELKPGASVSMEIASVKALGPEAEKYLSLIPSQTASIRGELKHLMVLIAVYGERLVLETINKALREGVIGAVYLERWLVQGESKLKEKSPPPMTFDDPRLDLPHITTDIRSYNAILLKDEEDL